MSFKLTPILAPWVDVVLNSHEKLRDLMTDASAPVELLHPETLKINVEQLRAALRHHQLPTDQIYFACKANAHPSFLLASNETGIGVDVTSEHDLQSAINAGFLAERIIVTSSVKTDSLLRLCARHQITTVIDSFEELYCMQQLNLKYPIMLRLGGWPFKEGRSETRFGFYPEQLSQATELCKAMLLDIRGLQFHLKGYSLEERASGIEYALGITGSLREAGFKPTTIDIGGGIPVNYLQSQAEWREFNAALISSIINKTKAVTYSGDGLGYSSVNGRLLGSPTFYPYWNELVKGDYVSALLSHPLKNGLSIAQNLRGSELTLQIEPGRALLDQCGALIAKVAFTKTDSSGRHLTGLFMNRTQLMSSSSDFCLDPIALSKRPERPTYLVGSHCIENDLIMKRELLLPELKRGDLLIIPNTAAYVTSLFASNSHNLGEVKRIILDSNGALP